MSNNCFGRRYPSLTMKPMAVRMNAVGAPSIMPATMATRTEPPLMASSAARTGSPTLLRRTNESE
jgi:hypothetical protein